MDGRAWLVCDEIEGPYSEVWSFTSGSGGTIPPAPTLIAPADGITLTTVPVTLEWSAVNEAVEYLFGWRKVDQSFTFVTWVPDTEITMYSQWFTPDTTYQWWVEARSDYAIGPASTTWEFTTPSDLGAAHPVEDADHSMVVRDSEVRIEVDTLGE